MSNSTIDPVKKNLETINPAPTQAAQFSRFPDRHYILAHPRPTSTAAIFRETTPAEPRTRIRSIPRETDYAPEPATLRTGMGEDQPLGGHARPGSLRSRSGRAVVRSEGGRAPISSLRVACGRLRPRRPPAGCYLATAAPAPVTNGDSRPRPAPPSRAPVAVAAPPEPPPSGPPSVLPPHLRAFRVSEGEGGSCGLLVSRCMVDQDIR